MSEIRTIIKLISLNADDFIKVADKFLNQPLDTPEEIHRIQAQMLGHAKLLELWLGKLRFHYSKLTKDEQFIGAVDANYDKKFKTQVAEKEEDSAILIHVKLSPETLDAIFNAKATYLERGLVPNWMFLNEKFVNKYPELRQVKELSGMSVHICKLPADRDIMIVSLEDKNET